MKVGSLVQVWKLYPTHTVMIGIYLGPGQRKIWGWPYRFLTTKGVIMEIPLDGPTYRHEIIQ